MEQYAVAASAGYRLRQSLSLRFAAGGILGGSLETEQDGRRFEIQPGFLFSAGVAYRWQFGSSFFLTPTASAGASFTRTEEDGGMQARESLVGIDVRFGVLAGVTVLDRVSPYLAARGFGGAILWTFEGESLTGRDQNNFQLGFGTSVLLPAQIAVQVDASVLGERSLSVAAARGF